MPTLKISQNRKNEIINAYNTFNNAHAAAQQVEHYIVIQATYEAMNPYTLINEKERYETLQAQKTQFEKKYPSELSRTALKNEIDATNEQLSAINATLEKNRETLQALQKEINTIDAQIKNTSLSSSLIATGAVTQNITVQKLESELASLKLQPTSPQTERAIEQKQRSLEKARATQNTLNFTHAAAETLESYTYNKPAIYAQLRTVSQKIETANTLYAENKNKKATLEKNLDSNKTKISELNTYEATQHKLKELESQANGYCHSTVGQQQIAALQNTISDAIKNMGGMDNYNKVQSHFKAVFSKKSERKSIKQHNASQQAERNKTRAGIAFLIAFGIGFIGMLTANPTVLAIASGILFVGAITGIVFAAIGNNYQTKATTYAQKTEKLNQDLKAYCIPHSMLQVTSETVHATPAAPASDEPPPAYKP